MLLLGNLLRKENVGKNEGVWISPSSLSKPRKLGYRVYDMGYRACGAHVVVDVVVPDLYVHVHPKVLPQRVAFDAERV